MRLAVDPRGGLVRLTLPRRAPLADAYRWVETKRGWVEAQLEALPRACPIEPRLRFCFAGETVTVDWNDRNPRTPLRVGDTLRVGGPRDQLSPRLLRWLKTQARLKLDHETRALAATIGVAVGSVGVGDPVSRWGSCSAGAGIRYSWRLILAPDFVRRATVAHEVAHLVHLNHGPDFHALAAKLFGADPAPARRWLRASGAALHWFGRER